MNSEWEATTLGEIVVRSTESVTPQEIAGSVPYVGLEHIVSGGLHLLDVGRASDVESAKTIFRAGDVLFGKLRPYFRKVIRAPFDGICSTDIWVLRPKDPSRLDPGFLFYLVADQRAVDFAMAGASGTRMPRARWEHWTRLQVSLPSLGEQRAIAGLLGTLDAKIDLNQRIAQILDAVSSAVFRQQPLTDTHVRDIATVTMGQSPPGDTYNESGEGLPFFQGRRDFGLRFPTARVFCTDPRRVAEEGDVLVSVRAPVGSVNVATTKSIVGRGCAALRSPHRAVLYEALRSSEGWQVYNAEGTVFGAITKKLLESFKVAWPEDPATAEGTLSPIQDQILLLWKESSTLRQIRDALLPELISGRMRIPEAEALVEEAV